jgi:hypothetical protein
MLQISGKFLASGERILTLQAGIKWTAFSIAGGIEIGCMR